MSISNNISTHSYTGTAVAGATYVVDFPFNLATELSVYTTDSNSNVVTLTYTSSTLSTGKFTVSGGSGTTGSVTVFDAVPATSTLTIARNVDYTQLTSYTTGDRLPAATIEASFDKITQLCQQLKRGLGKCVRGSDTAADISALPSTPSTGTWTLSLVSGALQWLNPSTVSIGAGSVVPSNLTTSTNSGWSFAAVVTGLAGFIGNLTGNVTGNVTGNADTATIASACSGNAATATTAAACSGNAATATTAAACSGNAATATAPQAASTLSKITCKAWVNFDGTTTSAWPGGTSTVSRTSGSTTATVTTTTSHGLVVGNQVYAATGVVAGTYTIVTVPSSTTFTFATVASTALNANAITFNACTIRSGYNVNLITRSSTGIYLVNFFTPMVDVNYSASVSVNSSNAVFMTQDNAFYQNGLQVACSYYNGTTSSAIDQSTVCVQIFGN